MTQSICYLLLSLYSSDPSNAAVYSEKDVKESCAKYVGIVRTIYTSVDDWYHPKKKKKEVCACTCPKMEDPTIEIEKTEVPILVSE
jgi:predicted metal-dependent hydrolase